MTELLTRDQEKADQLDEELSQTFFSSAEQFVKIYSEGLINRQNEDVKRIAEKVTSIYQNVQLKGREIVFVSQTETMVDDAISLLRPWRHITKIKRAAEESSGDIFLLSDQVGYLFTKNTEGEYVKLATERFYRNEQDAEDLYKRFSSYSNSEPNGAVLETANNASDEDDGDFDSELANLEEEENYNSDENVSRVYKFSKDDLAGIDDSFIVDIYDLLKS